MIKLIVFDMAGVLTSSWEFVPCILKETKIDYNLFNQIMRSDYDNFLKGIITSDEFWDLFNKKTGKKVSENLFIKCFNPVLNYELIEYVKNNIDISIKKVIGTNAPLDHYLIHKERGDYKYFDKVYCSSSIGYKKPEENFFIHIIKNERILPEEVLYFDDNGNYVQVSKDIGINGFHYKGFSSFKEAIENFNILNK